MLSKSTSLLLLILLFNASALIAQKCDPWIVKIYAEAFNLTPDGYDCNIKNYNNGSWNSYDELKNYIIKFRKSNAGNDPIVLEAEGKCRSKGYSGLCTIAEFVNEDFPIAKTTCGQAAVVTALWQAGLSSTKDPEKLIKAYYKYAPPKVSAGLEFNQFGTDWRQINYGLDGYASQGIRYNWQKGIPALKNELNKKLPCLIMIDTGTLPQYGTKWLTGHWVVAYGYDDQYVYVTNFPKNKMLWTELNKAWGGVWNEGHLAKVHGTAEMFAVVYK